ncbi:MAG: hypothetical protein V8T31_11485 [Lachnospiraceae bacterium]
MANLDKITILIKKERNFELILLSFPTRERRLKSKLTREKPNVTCSSFHAGTWIEIPDDKTFEIDADNVVPHAGTWIEIYKLAFAPGL